MSLEKNKQNFVCKSLSLCYQGNNYPLKVRKTDLIDGSETYSVEIKFGDSDTVVIDTVNLADGLREAETILPLAYEARKTPSH